DGPDSICYRPSRCQGLLDRCGVPLGAVRRQTEPEWQAAGPPGQVHPVIPRVPDLAVNRVKIAGPLGVGCAGEFRLPVDQTAPVVGGEKPLVWVDDEAVGPLDSGEEVTHARW